MVRPTRRAILAAALGLPVALLPVVVLPRLWSLWLLYGALLTCFLAVDGLLAPRRREIEVAIEMPQPISIGVPAEALLTVRLLALRHRRPVPVAVAVDLSERLAAQPPLRGVLREGRAQLRLALVARRRGRVEVERAWVRALGPLGLLARAVTRQLGEQAIVAPNLHPVKATALAFATRRDFRAGLRIERYTGDGTEFDSLRSFTHGDDRRVIDWKASAHHSRLVARQYRAERNQQVICAIDTGRLMCEPLGGIPKLDHAVSSALLLAYVSLRAGDRVGLATFDARPGLWVEPRGGIAAHQLLSRMAGGVEYSEAETNFTLGLTALSQRLSRRSLVVVMTDFVDTVTAELMQDNVARLATHHLVIFVALQDPGLVALTEQPPVSALDLNRAVVAAGLLRDREVVLRRLRQLGVLAIDALPSQVDPRLLNAYLEVKRRERI